MIPALLCCRFLESCLGEDKQHWEQGKGLNSKSGAERSRGVGTKRAYMQRVKRIPCCQQELSKDVPSVKPLLGHLCCCPCQSVAFSGYFIAECQPLLPASWPGVTKARCDSGVLLSAWGQHRAVVAPLGLRGSLVN